ncbi:hypothetical protein [Lactobacillus sp. ESL0677]|uniref:hypothetical protein n=1 Tax=Lactobacillus sp. ESL0677 TaxID=2983208 RepID=UPI0023F67D98|nr:hypothetical protein [Lactobacillus sp. ESL0677]WEV36209.1 hypothetical protein OZX76_05535 [Lactobacillus sp. ESL0677]
MNNQNQAIAILGVTIGDLTIQNAKLQAENAQLKKEMQESHEHSETNTKHGQK